MSGRNIVLIYLYYYYYYYIYINIALLYLYNTKVHCVVKNLDINYSNKRAGWSKRETIRC